MVVILSALGRDVPSLFDIFLRLEPSSLSHYSGFLLGMGLVYMAFQIRRRKRVAYNLTLLIIGLIIALGLVLGHSLVSLAIYAPILALMYVKRCEFIVKSDADSWKRSLIVGGSLLLAVATFVTVTFLVIDQYQFGRDITTSESLNITIDAVLGKPLPEFVGPTRQDKLLIELIQLSTIAAIGVAVFSIFSPVRFRHSAGPAQTIKAKQLLEKYGGSTEDHFKLWPADKHYFFYGDSMVAFGVYRRVAVVLDGASGNPRQFTRLRRLFIEECHRNGWMVAVLHADTKELDKWKKLGLGGLMIGSEAIIDVAKFNDSTYRSKHFRYIKNKAEKEQLSVEFWGYPHTVERLSLLRAISDSWIENGRREYTFAMGYFDDDYLNLCNLAVLVQEGKAVGYTNLMPNYLPGAESIDHMRGVQGLPSVGMHFLLMELIRHLGEKDTKTFNLGLAPLSQLEMAPSSVTKSILSMARKLGNRYYSFMGLEQFKNKFEPEWQPKYIAYEGSEASLVEVSLAINHLLAYKPRD